MEPESYVRFDRLLSAFDFCPSPSSILTFLVEFPGTILLLQQIFMLAKQNVKKSPRTSLLTYQRNKLFAWLHSYRGFNFLLMVACIEMEYYHTFY